MGGGNCFSPPIFLEVIMSLFICPVCKKQLNFENKTAYCENGHSYDVSKQGYVNLLPPNKRHSQNPGDSKEMVLSRRQFLEGKKYDCFSDKINQLIIELLGNRQNITILDWGCGEGYYDGRLTENLEKLNINYNLYGFDISKNAVRFGAGKYKNLHLAVGSCYDAPLKSNSFDVVLNVFAPMVESEICRCLKNGGYLIYAVPGKNHLMGIKKVLYENTYENTVKHTEYEGFEFVKRYSVNDVIEVEGEELKNLFTMTPYYYKSEKNATEKLLKNGKIKTEIEFDFLIYKKI